MDGRAGREWEEVVLGLGDDLCHAVILLSIYECDSSIRVGLQGSSSSKSLRRLSRGSRPAHAGGVNLPPGPDWAGAGSASEMKSILPPWSPIRFGPPFTLTNSIAADTKSTRDQL